MTDRKVTARKLADMVVMRAACYSNYEIAEKVGVSVSTIEYHFGKIKRRAEEIGAHMAVLEVLIGAGPDYLLFRFSPFKVTPEEVVKELEKEG